MKRVFSMFQMLITASQILWTTNVTKALVTSKERGDNSSLKSIKKKQVWILQLIVSVCLCLVFCLGFQYYADDV